MREESVPRFLSPSHSELPLPLTRNQVTSRVRVRGTEGGLPNLETARWERVAKGSLGKPGWEQEGESL